MVDFTLPHLYMFSHIHREPVTPFDTKPADHVKFT